MAGQVTFDFGFDTFLFGAAQGYMQVVPGFQMRSYGTLEIDITAAAGGNGDNYYKADAVVNNTSPLVSALNPATGLEEIGGGGVYEAYYNTVSFMGEVKWSIWKAPWCVTWMFRRLVSSVPRKPGCVTLWSSMFVTSALTVVCVRQIQDYHHD